MDKKSLYFFILGMIIQYIILFSIALIPNLFFIKTMRNQKISMLLSSIVFLTYVSRINPSISLIILTTLAVLNKMIDINLKKPVIMILLSILISVPRVHRLLLKIIPEVSIPNKLKNFSIRLKGTPDLFNFKELAYYLSKDNTIRYVIPEEEDILEEEDISEEKINISLIVTKTIIFGVLYYLLDKYF